MRRLSKSLITPALLMAVMTATALLPTAAFADRCEAQFDAVMAQLAIPKERIKDAFSVNVYTRQGSGLERVERWVSFNDCKGNLVIKTDHICRPMDNYTTYECRVPGVRNY
ncbi:hypothetical protein GQF03_08860 [Sneathiella chungangensis]|uniref:Uncharacterized protein n=1 Tax=Sneathiella chungangensis TaxID=1418234 RepID=A0A845MFL3_9PROT|nr:hypothetical protein [Sneathiella chungangensis]MZR22441.1 hypothetical protein [Sneathiella chungangensis]